MKFTNLSVSILAAIASQLSPISAECPDIIPSQADPSLGIKVTRVNAVPTANTDAGSYNLHAYENIAGKTIFVDQKEGILWSYDSNNGGVKEIYNIAEEGLPDGVDVDGFIRPIYNFNSGSTYKIHSVAAGPNSDEMIVVFTSSTLPSGATAVPLPNSPEYRMFDVDDCSNPEAIESVCIPFAFQQNCCSSQLAYKLFYKFKLPGNSRLVDPELIFAHEQQKTYGHDGGAMLTVPNDAEGRFFWVVGDCLPFGWNGLFAPQDDTSICGKMILVNPSDPGQYEIVAKGIRNSQQMFIEGDNVHFTDIGAVTAEEFNTVPLVSLLNGSMPNFGWGETGEKRTDKKFGQEKRTDKKFGREKPTGKKFGREKPTSKKFAREGTFIIETGSSMAFHPNPKCIDVQTKKEQKGFILPWLQFGNDPASSDFFAIAGGLVSPKSFDKIKVAVTEFNSGALVAGIEEFGKTGPVPAFFVKMYKDDSAGGIVELENGFNDLVADELGVSPSRGDPRMFRYPDGTAGVLIERTGVFYQLEEIEV